MKLIKIIAILLICAAFECQAALSISNNTPTNVTANTALLSESIYGTNSVFPSVSIFWGLTNGTTNATGWLYSTNLGTISSIPTNLTVTVTNLASATQYYSRPRAQEVVGGVTSTVWASSTVNFWTTYPKVSTVTMMIGTNGVLPNAFTNFFDANLILLSNSVVKCVQGGSGTNSGVTSGEVVSITAPLYDTNGAAQAATGALWSASVLSFYPLTLNPSNYVNSMSLQGATNNTTLIPQLVSGGVLTNGASTANFGSITINGGSITYVPNFGGIWTVGGDFHATTFTAGSGGLSGPGTGLTSTGSQFTAGNALALGGVSLGGLVQTQQLTNASNTLASATATAQANANTASNLAASVSANSQTASNLAASAYADASTASNLAATANSTANTASNLAASAYAAIRTNLFGGSGTTGLVTSAAGDAGNFLRADGVWASASASGVSQGELWATNTSLIGRIDGSTNNANLAANGVQLQNVANTNNLPVDGVAQSSVNATNIVGITKENIITNDYTSPVRFTSTNMYEAFTVGTTNGSVYISNFHAGSAFPGAPATPIDVLIQPRVPNNGWAGVTIQSISDDGTWPYIEFQKGRGTATNMLALGGITNQYGYFEYPPIGEIAFGAAANGAYSGPSSHIIARSRGNTAWDVELDFYASPEIEKPNFKMLRDRMYLYSAIDTLPMRLIFGLTNNVNRFSFGVDCGSSIIDGASLGDIVNASYGGNFIWGFGLTDNSPGNTKMSLQSSGDLLVGSYQTRNVGTYGIQICNSNSTSILNIGRRRSTDYAYSGYFPEATTDGRNPTWGSGLYSSRPDYNIWAYDGNANSIFLNISTNGVLSGNGGGLTNLSGSVNAVATNIGNIAILDTNSVMNLGNATVSNAATIAGVGISQIVTGGQSSVSLNGGTVATTGITNSFNAPFAFTNIAPVIIPVGGIATNRSIDLGFTSIEVTTLKNWATNYPCASTSLVEVTAGPDSPSIVWKRCIQNTKLLQNAAASNDTTLVCNDGTGLTNIEANLGSIALTDATNANSFSVLTITNLVGTTLYLNKPLMKPFPANSIISSVNSFVTPTLPRNITIYTHRTSGGTNYILYLINGRSNP